MKILRAERRNSIEPFFEVGYTFNQATTEPFQENIDHTWAEGIMTQFLKLSVERDEVAEQEKNV